MTEGAAFRFADFFLNNARCQESRLGASCGVLQRGTPRAIGLAGERVA